MFPLVWLIKERVGGLPPFLYIFFSLFFFVGGGAGVGMLPRFFLALFRHTCFFAILLTNFILHFALITLKAKRWQAWLMCGDLSVLCLLPLFKNFSFLSSFNLVAQLTAVLISGLIISGVCGFIVYLLRGNT